MILSPSDCLLLQTDVSRLSNWSNHWKLSFNELKCTLIHFSPNSPEFIENFTLNQHQLSVSNSYKDLGVILTSNLDFSDHYTYISGQAYKILGLLRRTFSNCTCYPCQETPLYHFSPFQINLLLLCLVLTSPSGYNHSQEHLTSYY